MIRYTTLGTNDKERAAAFYDELLGTLGAKRIYEMDKMIAWGNGPQTPMLMIIKPADGNKATVGNGVMVALAAKDKAEVDATYFVCSPIADTLTPRRSPNAIARRLMIGCHASQPRLV